MRSCQVGLDPRGEINVEGKNVVGIEAERRVSEGLESFDGGSGAGHAAEE